MIRQRQVFVKRLSDKAILPTYAHGDDAGMDLYAVESIYIQSGRRATVRTGISIAIPEGFVGLIHPRSGMAARQGLTVLNAPGTIDSGYRGEVMVILHNTSNNGWNIYAGDKIAQLVLQEYHRAELIETDELPEGIRAANGFGSTGS